MAALFLIFQTIVHICTTCHFALGKYLVSKSPYPTMEKIGVW